MKPGRGCRCGRPAPAAFPTLQEHELHPASIARQLAALRPDKSLGLLDELLEGRLTQGELFRRSGEVLRLAERLDARVRETAEITKNLHDVQCQPSNAFTGIL